MAKQIKVIKCPQCGSTDKTEIKPDFYRCNSCQTEYFLDDDDVTINYNHNYNHNNNPAFGNDASKKAIKVVAIVFGVIMLLVILINILSAVFSSSNSSNSPAQTYSVTERVPEEQGFSASRYNPQLVHKSGTDQPLFMVLESRRYRASSEEKDNGLYLVVYDPLAKKELAAQKVGDDNFSGSNVSIRSFNDGNMYVIIDKTTLYQFDKERLKLVEAGKKFFSAKQELQIGVATVEFVYSDNGDGLVLLSNDGKKFYYYPLVQKLYKEDDYYDARRGFSNLLPGAQEKTIHVFTRQSSDYPEDKLMLLKIRYKDNGSGPKDVPDNISWRKDYGGSGIFTDRDPYRKVLFDSYMKASERVIDWKDLTPQRLYFSPEVLLDEGGTLIISFKANAAPNSAYKMQKINSSTGTPEWTADLPKDQKFKSVLNYKSGYIAVADSDELFFYDNKGIQTGNFKLD